MAYTKKAHIPVRRGGVYCAPFCGANCTWAAFQDATKKAKDMARKLGPGWEPRVSENMCWYWGATKGVMIVYASRNHGGDKRRPGEYTCYCNTSPQFLGFSSDPLKSVEEAIASLDEHIASIIKQRNKLGFPIREKYDQKKLNAVIGAVFE